MKRMLALAFVGLLSFSSFAAAPAVPGSAIGKIVKLPSDKGLVEAGDRITILFLQKKSLVPGTRLEVFKVREDLINSGSDLDDEGKTEEVLGTVEVVKQLNPRKAVGKVVLALTEIGIGSWVRLETPPAN